MLACPKKLLSLHQPHTVQKIHELGAGYRDSITVQDFDPTPP
jgi:hypothetical protein